jgi:hypothetical protein
MVLLQFKVRLWHAASVVQLSVYNGRTKAAAREVCTKNKQRAVVRFV